MTVVSRRMKQKAITSLARGRSCQIRIVGVCNGDPETTVPCHLRMHGISGIGYIADSIFVAWGCSDCHSYCDMHSDDATKRAFYEGVFRTQAILLREGRILDK